MPTYRVPGPDGRIYVFEGPEGVSERDLKRAAEQAYYSEPAPDKSKEGFKAAFSAGVERAKGEAALVAGKLGLMSPADAQRAYEAQREVAATKFTPTEDSWFQSPLLKMRELAGGSAPSMLVPAAAAGLGALAATGVGAPAAAGIAGLGLGALTSGTMFTGSNLARQVETGRTLAEASGVAAATTAVGQTALDLVSFRMIPGLSRIFGAAGVKVTEQEAARIASQKLREKVADYTAATGKAMTAEGVTEAAQSVLERAQAGLSLSDADARNEYFENFIGGAVLGGAIAPVGRAYERARTVREGTLLGQQREEREAQEGQALASVGPPTLPDVGQRRLLRLQAARDAASAEIAQLVQNTDGMPPEQIQGLEKKIAPLEKKIAEFDEQIKELENLPAPDVLKQQEAALLSEMQEARTRNDAGNLIELSKKLLKVRQQLQLHGDAPISATTPAAAAPVATPAAAAPVAAPAATTTPAATTDPLYAQAVAVVQQTGNPSISVVQRHFRIGYNRAARLVEQMEAAGVVSPMAEDGTRQLLVKTPAPAVETETAPSVKTETAPAGTQPTPVKRGRTKKAAVVAEEAVVPAAEEAATPVTEEAATPAAEEAVAPAAEEAAKPAAEEAATPAAEEAAKPAKEAAKQPVAEAPPSAAKPVGTLDIGTVFGVRERAAELREMLAKAKTPVRPVPPSVSRPELARAAQAWADFAPRRGKDVSVPWKQLDTTSQREWQEAVAAGKPTIQQAENIAARQSVAAPAYMTLVRKLLNQAVQTPKAVAAIDNDTLFRVTGELKEVLNKRIRDTMTKAPRAPGEPEERVYTASVNPERVRELLNDIATDDEYRDLLAQSLKERNPELIKELSANLTRRIVVVKEVGAREAGKPPVVRRPLGAEKPLPPAETPATETAATISTEKQDAASLEAATKLNAELEEKLKPLNEELGKLQETLRALIPAREAEKAQTEAAYNDALAKWSSAVKGVNRLLNSINAQYASKIEALNKELADVSFRAKTTVDLMSTAITRRIDSLLKDFAAAPKRAAVGPAAAQNRIAALHRLQEKLSDFRALIGNVGVDTPALDKAQSELTQALSNAVTVFGARSKKATKELNEIAAWVASLNRPLVEAQQKLTATQTALKEANEARLMAVSLKQGLTGEEEAEMLRLSEEVDKQRDSLATLNRARAAVSTVYEEKKSELREAIGAVRADIAKTTAALMGAETKDGTPRLSRRYGKGLLIMDQELLDAQAEVLLVAENGVLRALIHGAQSPAAKQRLAQRYGKEAREQEERLLQAMYGDMVTPAGTAVPRTLISFTYNFTEKQQKDYDAAQDILYSSPPKKTGDPVRDAAAENAHIQAQEKAQEKIEGILANVEKKRIAVVNKITALQAKIEKLTQELEQKTAKLNIQRDGLLAKKKQIEEDLVRPRSDRELALAANDKRELAAFEKGKRTREQLLKKVNDKLQKALAALDTEIGGIEAKFAQAHDDIARQLTYAQVALLTEQSRSRGIERTRIPTRAEKYASQREQAAAREAEFVQSQQGKLVEAAFVVSTIVDRIAATQTKRRVSTPLTRQLIALSKFKLGTGAEERSTAQGRSYPKLMERQDVVVINRGFLQSELKKFNELTDSVFGKNAAEREQAGVAWSRAIPDQPTAPQQVSQDETVLKQLTAKDRKLLQDSARQMNAAQPGVATLDTRMIGTWLHDAGIDAAAFDDARARSILLGRVNQYFKGAENADLYRADFRELLGRLFDTLIATENKTVGTSLKQKAAGIARDIKTAQEAESGTEMSGGAAVAADIAEAAQEGLTVEGPDKLFQRTRALPATADALNEREVKALRDNDIIGALDSIIERSMGTMQASVAARLSQLLGNTRVSIVKNLRTPEGKPVLGGASVNGLDIYLDADGGMNVETLLHEGIHAGTELVLRIPRDQLTEQQRQAVAELERLWAAAKADKRIPLTPEARESLSEFLAESLSSVPVQEALANKPWQVSNFWEKFKSILLRIMGVKTPKTMLDATAMAADALFRAPQTRAQKEAAFKQWFGNSKVVDENGEPLVVYHGTSADFSAFDPSQTGNSTDLGFYGSGSYFTNRPSSASGYAKGEGGRVMPVYLSIKNPYYTSEQVLSDEELAKVRAGGHDGIIAKVDDSGYVEYVVFKPTQIKSAIGNVGTFDPTDPDIRYQVSRPVANPNVDKGVVSLVGQLVGRQATAGEKIKAFASGLSLRTRLVDSWAPVEALMERGVKSGDLTEAQAFQLRINMRLHAQANQYTTTALTRGVPKLKTGAKGERYFEADDGANAVKISKVLSKANFGNQEFTEQLFTSYLAVLRAERPGIGYEKMNFGKDKDGKPLLTAESAAQIKELVERDPKNKAVFEEARALYREYNNNLIDALEASGFIDSEKATELKQGDFVPYYRIDGEVVNLETGASRPITIGNIVDQPYLRELVGDNTRILPIFSSMTQNTAMIMRTALRNMQAKDVGFMLADLGYGVLSNKNIPYGKGTRMIVKDAAEGEASADPDRWASGGVIHFKYKGQDRSLVINAKLLPDDIPADLLMEGLQGVKTAMPALAKTVLGQPASILRKFITRSPVYILRQLIREPMHAWMTTGGDINPLMVAMGGLRNIFTKPSASEDVLQRAGVISSNVYTNDLEDLSRILRDIQSGGKGINGLLGKLDEYALRADAQTRTAVYDSFRRRGMTHTEALLASLESMNFARRGTSASMLWLSTMIPFFHSQVQGLDAAYRAAMGKMPYEQKMKASTMLWQRGMLLAGMTLLYTLLMQDDESYKNATPEERAMNWFIPLPGGGGSIRFPIPFEFGLLFKAIPEALVNVGTTDLKASEAMRAIAKQLYMTSPLSLPAAIQPPIELATNYSFFTDQPIESSREQRLEPAERFRTGTTELAKLMGSTFNVSPVMLEHVVRGYTGSIGIAVMSLINPLLRPLGPDTGERPDMPLARTPVLGTLIQPENGRGVINAAYDDLKRVKRATATYDQLVAQGRMEEAQQFSKDFASQLAMASTGGSFEQQMGELAQMKRDIAVMKTLSGEQKRQQIESIERIERQMATTLRKLVTSTE